MNTYFKNMTKKQPGDIEFLFQENPIAKHTVSRLENPEQREITLLIFSNYVRSKRIKNKWTRRYLEKKLKLSRGYLSNIETAYSSPSSEVIHKIFEVFNAGDRILFTHLEEEWEKDLLNFSKEDLIDIVKDQRNKTIRVQKKYTDLKLQNPIQGEITKQTTKTVNTYLAGKYSKFRLKTGKRNKAIRENIKDADNIIIKELEESNRKLKKQLATMENYFEMLTGVDAESERKKLDKEASNVFMYAESDIGKYKIFFNHKTESFVRQICKRILSRGELKTLREMSKFGVKVERIKE